MNNLSTIHIQSGTELATLINQTQRLAECYISLTVDRHATNPRFYRNHLVYRNYPQYWDLWVDEARVKVWTTVLNYHGRNRLKNIQHVERWIWRIMHNDITRNARSVQGQVTPEPLSDNFRALPDPHECLFVSDIAHVLFGNDPTDAQIERVQEIVADGRWSKNRLVELGKQCGMSVRGARGWASDRWARLSDYLNPA